MLFLLKLPQSLNNNLIDFSDRGIFTDIYHFSIEPVTPEYSKNKSLVCVCPQKSFLAPS